MDYIREINVFGCLCIGTEDLVVTGSYYYLKWLNNVVFKQRLKLFLHIYLALSKYNR